MPMGRNGNGSQRNARNAGDPGAALAAKLEAARRALAEANAAEADAKQKEAAARARAEAATSTAGTSAGGLLLLSRDGHRGNLWIFAKGTWDNPTLVPADVELQISRLALPVHGALILDTVDEALTAHLRDATYCADWSALTHAGRHARILGTNCKEVLNRDLCRLLRDAVDAERDRTKDTVDGFAQHQLGMTIAGLQLLIGQKATSRLRELPTELLAQRSSDAQARAAAEATNQVDACVLAEAVASANAAAELAASAASQGYHINVFIRRYSRDTRPWIGFHTDLSTVTVNVALSADASHEGGHLHAIIDGKHQLIERGEGEATVHSDDVMHGVSAMRSGVRYALILFFFKN